jgi:hypothetical protein
MPAEDWLYWVIMHGGQIGSKTRVMALEFRKIDKACITWKIP